MTEIYEFLRFLGCPACVIDKAPSAGLFDGQTDEDEMGIAYRDVDAYLLGEKIPDEVVEKIERRFAASAHKRRMPLSYSDKA